MIIEPRLRKYYFSQILPRGFNFCTETMLNFSKITGLTKA